jgi:hypothetical protein
MYLSTKYIELEEITTTEEFKRKLLPHKKFSQEKYEIILEQYDALKFKLDCYY